MSVLSSLKLNYLLALSHYINIRPMLSLQVAISNWQYVTAYIIAAALISFAVLYRMAPPTNERTLSLIQWTVQLGGVACIFLSFPMREVGVASVMITLLLYNFRGWSADLMLLLILSRVEFTPNFNCVNCIAVFQVLSRLCSTLPCMPSVGLYSGSSICPLCLPLFPSHPLPLSPRPKTMDQTNSSLTHSAGTDRVTFLDRLVFK